MVSIEDKYKAQPETCTYYTRVAFGMMRCCGSTLAGKCGHPDKLCPINRQYQNKGAKV
jgi:hypothetical protein